MVVIVISSINVIIMLIMRFKLLEFFLGLLVVNVVKL